MTELWLKFKDEKGDDQRVLVTGNKFVIGRHSENDLCIPNGKLSRQHLKIEVFAEVFIVSDCGSSNGTTLNGTDLRDPLAIKDGDILNLGGGVEIEIELVSDKPKPKQSDNNSDGDFSGSSAVSSSKGALSPASGASSIPTAVFIAAPLMVIVLLVCGGGAIFFLGGNGGDKKPKGNELGTYYPTPDETPEKTKESPTPKPSSTVAGNTTVSPSPEETNTPPQPSDEKKTIEKNSTEFLHRIALKDSAAFLKTEQIEMVNSALSTFKGSSNLAENLKAVKNSASQFESLAQDKGFKAQFLATAALAKIGNNKGNPIEVAKQMLPFLSDLRVSLGNDLADDCLLIMADYPRRSANKKGSLQGVLEGIPKSTKLEKADAREIRTIWYLKRNNKISEEGFELALRFLAIGTITQNPKEFNVNAEAVIFN